MNPNLEMGLKFGKTGQPGVKRIVMIVYGFSGTGKTYFAGHSDNPLIFDFDRGTEGPLDDVEVATVRFDTTAASKAEFEKIINAMWLKPETFHEEYGFEYPIKTVVIDSITEMQNWILQTRMRETKAEFNSLRDFLLLMNYTTRYIDAFKAMDNFNLIITASVYEEKTEEFGGRRRLGVYGEKMPQRLAYSMEMIGLMEKVRNDDTGEYDYQINFGGDRTFEGKTRWEIPEVVPADFKALYKLVQKAKEAKREIAKREVKKK